MHLLRGSPALSSFRIEKVLTSAQAIDNAIVDRLGLGEWIELAMVVQDIDKNSRRSLSTVKAEGALQRRVLVMVEELP